MKYKREALEEAVENSVSFAGVLRFLGVKQNGGNHSYLTKKIKTLGIDTSHFTGKLHNKGKSANNRKTPEDILIVLPEGSHRPKTHQLRRAMIESGVDYRCEAIDCPHPEPVWAGKPLVLQIDHKDCNWLNNKLDNLQFLCPNCHSQEAC